MLVSEVQKNSIHGHYYGIFVGEIEMTITQ